MFSSHLDRPVCQKESLFHIELFVAAFEPIAKP